MASTGGPKDKLDQTRQLLQRCVETRMHAIQERISTAQAFCTTVEIEIQFGEFDRARDHVNKLRSTINGLNTHINNPAHVSDKQLALQFQKQLVQIEQRLFTLDSQINHHHRAPLH